MRKSALLMLTAVLALAACNSAPEKLPEDTVVDVDNAVEDANVADAAPVMNVTNAAENAAPKPDFTDEQQMADDADASGMTARLPDETPVPGNETLPAK